LKECNKDYLYKIDASIDVDYALNVIKHSGVKDAMTSPWIAINSEIKLGNITGYLT